MVHGLKLHSCCGACEVKGEPVYLYPSTETTHQSNQ